MLLWPTAKVTVGGGLMKKVRSDDTVTVSAVSVGVLRVSVAVTAPLGSLRLMLVVAVTIDSIGVLVSVSSILVMPEA